MIASIVFPLAFVLVLTLLRIALAKPLRKAQWFEDNSVKLALWASGWAIAVMVLGKVIGVDYSTIWWLAFAPILIIILAMFSRVIIEAPVFLWNSINQFTSFFKRDK